MNNLQSPAKKNIAVKKRKSSISCIPISTPTTGTVTSSDNCQLSKSIKSIDKENYQLKCHLLALINDYKKLKTLVINKQAPPTNDLLNDSIRKRSFHELDDINDLINDMNDLSHEPPQDKCLNISDSEVDDDEMSHPQPDIFSYINLPSKSSHLNLIDEEVDIFDEDIDDECDSPNLSRSTSPSGTSETDGENSLMTSLTRSTTVSTNNSSFVNNTKFPPTHSHNLNSYPFKFYDLPNYSTMNDLSSFNFSKNIDPHDPSLMSIIQEDNYNSVNDFLEEKLIDNDVSYYVNQQNN